ncbi:glycerol kinase GlpK [Aestuariibacter salexigens]|uniref:glycerol kinase GlpK n=1 Tax=Aestuariibacter salexigens TaxID=226010 RepID=UPI00040A93ED|nr:glycerol kinase GlpK [Aestuariibacter salexigens]
MNNNQNAVLSLDQGTTSSRAILFSPEGQALFTAQQEFAQHYPANGWVEHEPQAIWDSCVAVCREALQFAADNDISVVSMAIVNQRETTVVWNRKTGVPIYNAIVWQDRRTADRCQQLAEHAIDIHQRTGLRLDPYFSATKISWILDHVDGARQLAAQGELAFGTIDSFLISQLTSGHIHATDTTNASRTNLFNIKTMNWDPHLCELFDVPMSLLPEVKQSADDYGVTDPAILGQAIPIGAVVGDQQAALIGQGGLTQGDAKVTFGTGCFALVNTGQLCLASKNNLLSTVAYSVAGTTHYAVEGAVFIAGAAVQWLRDELGILTHAAQSEAIASSVNDDHGIVLVPAFTGLGAPHWQPDARGAAFGLTRDTGSAEIIRATLESVCFQTVDLLDAMAMDGIQTRQIKVDGGMVANNWLCQFLSDIAAVPVMRPRVMETTALGGAGLAMLQQGLIEDLSTLTTLNQIDRNYQPVMADEVRTYKRKHWNAAVQATLHMTQLTR